MDYRASQCFYTLFWKWFPVLISLYSIYFATAIRSENAFWELRAEWALGIKSRLQNL